MRRQHFVGARVLVFACLFVAGIAQAQPNLVCTVAGPPGPTQTNIDSGGLVTLSSGAGSYTFAGSYSTTPLCNCIDETNADPVSCSATTTSLSISGNGSDTIAYTCSFIKPTITPKISSKLPTMVDFQGFTVAGAEDARWFFDAFSWESFLAINQPATAALLYGNHPPRVWETWQSSRQIFPQTNTAECPDLANHPNAKVFVDGTSSGFHTSKLIPDYNEAFTYPLFDQTPAPVHYEVHINPTGSHTITSNGWTDPNTLPQVATFAMTPTTHDSAYSKGTISVTNLSNIVTGTNTVWSDLNNLRGRQIKIGPKASLYTVTQVQNDHTLVIAPPYQDTSASHLSYVVLQNPDAPYGIVEIKAAWRELPNLQEASRYYWEPAYVVDPGIPQSCRFVPMMGLVGLHIAHKASQGSNGVLQVTLPEWVWSTFEQIDNVPDGTPGQLPNHYSFNCQGKAGCQQPTGAAGGYSYQGVDGGNPPTQCSNAPWPEPMSPVEVIRIPGSQVAPVTQNVNQTLRKFLGPNSVWSNYQLISTQWPVAFNGQLMQESLLSNFNGYYPLNADCPFQVDHVANVTTETYEQGFSCIGCHYTAQTQNASNTKIVSWTDFSMTLAFGGQSSAQVQSCTTGAPQTGTPRQPGMPKFHASEHWQNLVKQMEGGGLKP